MPAAELMSLFFFLLLKKDPESTSQACSGISPTFLLYSYFHFQPFVNIHYPQKLKMYSNRNMTTALGEEAPLRLPALCPTKAGHSPPGTYHQPNPPAVCGEIAGYSGPSDINNVATGKVKSSLGNCPFTVDAKWEWGRTCDKTLRVGGFSSKSPENWDI